MFTVTISFRNELFNLDLDENFFFFPVDMDLIYLKTASLNISIQYCNLEGIWRVGKYFFVQGYCINL